MRIGAAARWANLRFGRIGAPAALALEFLIGGGMEKSVLIAMGAALVRATRARRGRTVSVE